MRQSWELGANAILGERIRRLRKRHGWTQQMLADQADLSLSYISMVEGGRRDIRWTTLLKLIVALECRPGDVLTTLARGRVAEHLREVR